jgi:hypothetical protein
MKIEHNTDYFILQISQKTYLQQVLDRFDTGLYKKTHSTLMTENFTELSKICEEDELLTADLQNHYQQITESL